MPPKHTPPSLAWGHVDAEARQMLGSIQANSTDLASVTKAVQDDAMMQYYDLKMRVAPAQGAKWKWRGQTWHVIYSFDTIANGELKSVAVNNFRAYGH